MPLLNFTSRGIYCAQADVYIDPSRAVDKAIITHGHSDHASPGSKQYMCSDNTVPALRVRLGKRCNVQGVPYGQSFLVNGVKFSFHPAGHIVGSAQVRVEYKGEIWVVTGDYKLEHDGLCAGYEPVTCHHFVTESTFALPIYHWERQEILIQDMLTWWNNNQKAGCTSLISAYSLGKAQRLIHHLNGGGDIFTHPTVEKMNRALRAYGIPIPETRELTPDIPAASLKKALIIAPSTSITQPEYQHITDVSVAFASGWMATLKFRKNRICDKGFAMSDHVDWMDVLKAIEASRASHVYVTHGYTKVLTLWLREQGYYAEAV